MPAPEPLYPGDAKLAEISRQHEAETRELLESLIRIPSLSLPGSPVEVLDQSAEQVKKAFSTLLEWDVCTVVRADGGAPAVIARKHPAPGKPTVLLYAHHDVQPAGDLALWASDPFNPDERNGRLYGRGSADDGAGIVVHHHALRVLGEALGEDTGLGLVLFIEGEEESGSPTFRSLLTEYSDLLSADLIVVADSDNPAPDRPALTTSLRGVVGVTVEVSTLESSVHSGLFGGPVPDALTTLIRLLGTLHDERGNVTIAGLAVDAPEELVGLDENELRRDSGLLSGVELWGEGRLAERLWWKPAVTITGIDAPPTEKASNTLLARAAAKVSLRIPPGITADYARQALETHLRSLAPVGVSLSFDRWEMGEGFSQNSDSPLIEKVRQALADGYASTVEEQGVGGSIPFVAHLQSAFPEASIAITGVEDRQSAAHGPNESVDLSMLSRAALSEALLLVRLACGV